jgi:hypothetical protein
MPGYSAVLAVSDMGEVVLLALIQLHRPAALVPVIDARASLNIIKNAEPRTTAVALKAGAKA